MVVHGRRVPQIGAQEPARNLAGRGGVNGGGKLGGNAVCALSLPDRRLADTARNAELCLGAEDRNGLPNEV